MSFSLICWVFNDTFDQFFTVDDSWPHRRSDLIRKLRLIDPAYPDVLTFLLSTRDKIHMRMNTFGIASLSEFMIVSSATTRFYLQLWKPVSKSSELSKRHAATPPFSSSCVSVA